MTLRTADLGLTALHLAADFSLQLVSCSSSAFS